MRASIVLAGGSTLMVIIAACASAEDEPPPVAPPPDSVLDGGAPDVEVPDVDVPDTRLPDCSRAGWCVTAFPDEDLIFRSVWPFEDVAFAIADSANEGVKFLEWKKSTNAWEYIDDNSQNTADVGYFAGGVYAPSPDEVYFTVGPSSVFHGKRPAAPETKWTWTRQVLPDNVVGHPVSHDHGRPTYNATREPRVTFGVWGTGAEDVYAYYSNTIFRRDSARGTWSPAHVVDDLTEANEHAFFVSASGTGPDDIWFVGGRDRTTTNCPLVVRKTALGWTHVADGIVSTSTSAACAERAGTLRIGGVHGGWIVGIQSVSPNEIIAVHDELNRGVLKQVNLTRIRETEGIYSFEQSMIPVKTALSPAPKVIYSLWRGSEATWFAAFGLILRSDDLTKYSPSTISRDGAPVDSSLFMIRGTSDQNIWAIGAQHAYHKTTP